MITASAWSALLIAAGFGAAQADAIARYSTIEASPDRGPYHASMLLDECSYSRLGESLLGVTGGLRGELHRYAGGLGNAWGYCVPAQLQAIFLAYAFPLHYPNCAARFARGDFGAFKVCWGEGRGS